MVNTSYVGNGTVKLIAGGGKLYTGIAASFCRTEKDLDDIIANDDTKNIIRSIVRSGHKAAMEFDNFIFGIQGYARVTEIQLVRKRHASYNIKSGRVNKNGKRSFDVILPKDIEDLSVTRPIDPNKVHLLTDDKDLSLADIIAAHYNDGPYPITVADFSTMDILNIIDSWYSEGVDKGLPEEDLRYIKPQGTEFKAAIMMNAAALRDWALIRMCNRAQDEIRDLCTKMVHLASNAAPVLFEGIGPSCVVYGYCPEAEQCQQRKGIVPTKEEAMKILKDYYPKQSKN